MKLFFDDAEMDGQLQRTLIAANAGSADLGETLATASRVTPGDYDSWFDEWAVVARRSEARASAALTTGHRVTARQAFLRASEYWRQAFFFIRHDLDDHRLQEAWPAHRAAFTSAIPLFDHDVVIDDVALDGAALRAYLFRAPDHLSAGTGAGRPVVVAPCGYDSTAEAGYAATAYMALKRGYDCVVFEGPGQGGVLYDQRVPMRPDFEVVLTPVIDWLVAQPDVDAAKIALVGRSFGGYLAPRAASVEHRIAALVCDPGQYDFVSRLVGKLFDEEYWEKVLAADPATDAELEAMLDTPHNREYFGARMTTMGAATVGDFLRLQPGYTLEGRVGDITCPVLVTEGEGDFASQSQVLVDHLTTQTTFARFADAEGAGGHCEGMGATLFEEVTFDWLDATLGMTAG
jgi:hypothetical protein